MTREEMYAENRQAIEKLMTAKGGMVKTNELYELGLTHRRIQRLVDDGFLKRVRNGYYSLEAEEVSDDTVILRLFGEDSVLTMESALYAYGYIKTKPYEYQIAVDRNTSKSRFKMEYPFVHPYYTEPRFLELGVTTIDFGGGRMKIYDKERLICECLKYEEHCDREIIKQALRAYIAETGQDKLKLIAYAKERRVMDKVYNRIGVWL